VDVYEAEADPGGMTRYGIPDYRLPATMLERDVEVITCLGARIHYNTRIGRDITTEQLRDEHDAVLLAIGLWTGRSTRIPGSDHAGVRRAVDLLRAVPAGEEVEVPRERGRHRRRQRRHGHRPHPRPAAEGPLWPRPDHPHRPEDRAHFLADPDKWNRGRLRVDAAGRTSERWLWAAGDMVRGPDAVSAVADGHRVAASIDGFLSVKEQAA
jgi:glutamate synthase (NADPH/NADH) small chain